jgi:hypothetical protein
MRRQFPLPQDSVLHTPDTAERHLQHRRLCRPFRLRSGQAKPGLGARPSKSRNAALVGFLSSSIHKGDEVKEHAIIRYVMLTRVLAAIAAAVPRSLKYRMRPLKPWKMFSVGLSTC